MVFRESAMRQGVIGTNRVALDADAWNADATVNVTETVCGLFVAPGALTEIVPAYCPSPRLAGFADTVKPVEVDVTLSHGTDETAFQGNVPPPVFDTPTICGGVSTLADT
jgi:hypothetical protein